MVFNYSDSLNLPKTKFKMKANLCISEKDVIFYWQNIKLYNLVKYINNFEKSFIISDGPPYANGPIHLGHALNKILKDIINKFKIIDGYKIVYIPGWDCHGLPIELNVEKKVKFKFSSINDKEFLIACKIYAKHQIEKQKLSFVRLGILADWDNPYLTMSNNFESSIINNLYKIIKNNYLYRGKKPVYWCFDCKSALAEAEIEYFNKESKSIDVIFNVFNLFLFEKCYVFYKKKNFYLGYGNCNVVIWTTTAWTLPANEAVVLNYNFIYVFIQIFNIRIVIVYNLLKSFLKRNNIKFYKLLSKCFGKNFSGKIYLLHPIFNTVVPLIFADYVTFEFGTGCVHSAPGHGYDDYIVGIKYGLSVLSIVDDNGMCILSGIFNGVFIDDLSLLVINFLKSKNRLLSCKNLIHSYPYCWRHKKPLIFRATCQFFISMDKNLLKDVVLKNIDTVIWQPNNGKTRIKSMVENRPDWCISRQRIWGVPIALFVNSSNDKIHPYTLFIFEKLSYLISKYGISIWRENDIISIIQSDNYFKILDILDVWFDSGSVYNYQKTFINDRMFPVDLYLEGTDQHRGWFQTSLFLSVANENISPYKKVLTHGFVLDSYGNKMSKSLGNVITPEKLVSDFGADIVRLWVSSINFQIDVNISFESINRVVEGYRKIRNTIRFLLSNIDDFSQNNLIDLKKMLIFDKWIVYHCIKLQKNIINDYNNYNFHGVYHKIQNFCVDELGSFYLDIIKDRQYTCKKNSDIRRSSQTAIFYILRFIIIWIAPILSFTSEEAWKYIPIVNEKSVFLSRWINLEIILYEKFSFDFWEKIILIKSLVYQFLENYRKFFLIGSFLELEVYLYCTVDLYLLLLNLENELKFLFICSNFILRLVDNRVENFSFFDGFYFNIKKSIYLKCDRCWHRVYSVNNEKICNRCLSNLSFGEQRCYL